MLAFPVLLLFVGLARCNSIDEDFSPTNPSRLVYYRSEYDIPPKPNTKTIYEQEFDQFKEKIWEYEFTKYDLMAMFGVEEAPCGDQMTRLLAEQLVEIIGLNEIRRVFGLKQQPMACDRLIDEKPLKKMMKINKKAMRLFQLSVLLFNQANQVFKWSPNLECQIPIASQQFMRAKYVYDKFPEIRRLFELKYAELGIEKFTFDKQTIGKAFEKLREATHAAGLFVHRGIEKLTDPSLTAYQKRYQELETLYDKAEDEKGRLLAEEDRKTDQITSSQALSTPRRIAQLHISDHFERRLSNRKKIMNEINN